MAKSSEANKSPVGDFSDWEKDVPAGWEDEQVGFPPYWNPSVGKVFMGTPLFKDERDPDFIRYHIQASRDEVCATGPADGAEPVPVKKGEIFTVSAYSGLPLDEFFGLEMMAVALKLVPTKKAGQERWVWKVRLPPQSKKLLQERRAQKATALATSAIQQ